MSGHSKWSTIKRQKGVNDSRRSAMFTKVAREVAVAARAGGGDPDANYRLRLAVEKARAINMPAENIKRAIEKATGGGDDIQYEEIVYEGYGPGGVAILVEAATDNRNRTAAEVRSIFVKAGGQLAGSGAVAWQFERKGVIAVPRAHDEEQILEVAMEAGAEDLADEDERWLVTSDPADLMAVRTALEEAGLEPGTPELTMVPTSTVEVATEAEAKRVLRLIEALDDHDDAQNVYANFDIPDEIMAAYEG